MIYAAECSSYGLPRKIGQVDVQLPRKARDAPKASDASQKLNVEMSNSAKSVCLGGYRATSVLNHGTPRANFCGETQQGLESLRRKYLNERFLREEKNSDHTSLLVG